VLEKQVSKSFKFKEVWSYSLFGNNFEMYFKPLLEVIPKANSVGARVIINTNLNNYEKITKYFAKYINTITILKYNDLIAEKYPKMLRFLVPLRVEFEYIFYKDSDSLVGDKELKIMQHWIKTARTKAMIIRDHPEHIAPILAGMFALNYEKAMWLAKKVEIKFNRNINYNLYSYDQDWLMEDIYPIIVNDAQVYTSYFYYSKEKIIIIPRSIFPNEHIGEQTIKIENNSNNCKWCLRIYNFNLLHLPYCILINKIFPKILYGRVRPTLISAFIHSKINKKNINYLPDRNI
jgi:hypothetical protein